MKITKNNLFFQSIFTLMAFFPLFFLTNCAKQKKSRDQLNNDELQQQALAYLDAKKYEEAAEYLELYVMKNPDLPDIGNFKLLLADAYFKTGKYPSACELYRSFYRYHPSDAKAEYAHYQFVLSTFYQTLKTDCDQTETESTITACNDYLNNTINQNHRSDVLDIQNTCEHKLINKEVYVYNFYLKRKKYDAAQNRLDHLRKNFLPKKPTLEARLLYLECQLAQQQHNDSGVQERLSTLLEKYPESQFTYMAQALVSSSKKNSFIF